MPATNKILPDQEKNHETRIDPLDEKIEGSNKNSTSTVTTTDVTVANNVLPVQEKIHETRTEPLEKITGKNNSLSTTNTEVSRKKTSKTQSESNGNRNGDNDDNKRKPTAGAGKKATTSEETLRHDSLGYETTTTRKRKVSSSSSRGTPVHDEKDVEESHKEVVTNKELKLHDNRDVTESRKRPTKDREKKIPAGNSFYLASQEPYRGEKTYYHKESGTWRAYSADSKRYWTKHPLHERSHTDRVERDLDSNSSRTHSREASPIRKSPVPERDNKYKMPRLQIVLPFLL